MDPKRLGKPHFDGFIVSLMRNMGIFSISSNFRVYISNVLTVLRRFLRKTRVKYEIGR